MNEITFLFVHHNLFLASAIKWGLILVMANVDCHLVVTVPVLVQGDTWNPHSNSANTVPALQWNWGGKEP